MKVGRREKEVGSLLESKRKLEEERELRGSKCGLLRCLGKNGACGEWRRWPRERKGLVASNPCFWRAEVKERRLCVLRLQWGLKTKQNKNSQFWWGSEVRKAPGLRLMWWLWGGGTLTFQKTLFLCPHFHASVPSP